MNYLQLVFTFECLGVNLLECDPVLLPLKYVDLLQNVQGSLSEVSLLGNGDLRVIVAIGELVVLGIRKHNERNPEILNFVS